MKKTTLVKTMLLLCALVVGSSSVWAEDVITEGFETASTGNDYQSTVTVATNKSDCGVSWEIYYGCVSTSSAISGSNSAALRLYTSENYGYLKTTSPINDLRKVSFKAKAATSNSAAIKINLLYSIDGSSWSAIKDGSGDDVIDLAPGSSASTYTYDIPTGGKYFKIEISSNSTKPSKKNAQLTIDDVAFTYGPYNPSTAIDGASIATITYNGGTLTDGVWTMTDNSDYTFQSTTDGKTLGKRTGTVYFKMGYPADYKITVPSTVAVNKIAITGYSTNTSTGTTITVGSTSQTIKSESTLYFDIASPSAGADVTFSTAAKEMDIISIELFTIDGITITTTANMNGWRAFYDATQDYTLDANTKAYVVRAKSGTENVVKLTKLDVTDIPHGEAVILKTSAADHKMVLTKTTGATTLGTNLLDKTDGTHNYDAYRLGYGSVGVGFYKYTATKPAAGIVYLDPEYVNLSAGARELTISFADDDVTAIEAVKAQNVVKGEYFNLAGQRVAQPTKGLYIVNGKKVIVK